MKRMIPSLLVLVFASATYASDPPTAKPSDPPSAPKLVKVKSKSGCLCGPNCQCASDDCPNGCPSRSVVSVHSVREYGTAHGSGTVIASEGPTSLVLTNAHVTRDGSRPITVVHTDEKGQSWEYKAEYVCGSVVRDTGIVNGVHMIEIDGPDLALLAVHHALPAAEIADQLPPVGSEVRQWGFARSVYGTRPTLKIGRVMDSAANYVEKRTVTSIPAEQGDSGSGVFYRGKLIGVCAASTASEPQIAVHLDSVYSFTFTSLDKRALFPRLRARVEEYQAKRDARAAVRAAAKAAAKAPAKAPEPPKAQGPKKEAPKAAPPAVIPASPAFGSCPDGQCAPRTQQRRGFFRR